jgi:dGTPase
MGEPSQSAEAAMMEIADDVSYALHDFEDFYRTGLITINALRRAAHGAETPKQAILLQVQRSLRERFDFGCAEEAWAVVTDWLDNEIFASLWDAYDGSMEQDAALVRLTSFQISKFIDGVSIDTGSAFPVVINSIIEHEIAIWKQMTWHFVINQPGFGAVQTGQSLLIRRTVEALTEWVAQEGIESPRLPRRLRDYFHIGIFDQDDPDYPNPDVDNVQSRAIIDYIASLTEPQLIDLHDKLTGAWRSSMIFGNIP